MHYILDSKKSVEQAAGDLEAAVKHNNFGVLHVYDLKATLAGKGFDLPSECRIFEVCNPAQAVSVLAADIRLNMALPCRISVYQDHGQTKIGTILPTKLLGLLSSDPGLAATASDVEAAVVRIMREAA